MRGPEPDRYVPAGLSDDNISKISNQLPSNSTDHNPEASIVVRRDDIHTAIMQPSRYAPSKALN